MQKGFLNGAQAQKSLSQSTPKAKLNPEEIKMQENKIRQDLRALAVKMAEHSQQTTEYQSVIAVLRTKTNEKKAYQMVGDVLSESTVGEVVPQLEQQLVRIAHIIGQYRAKQQEKEVELRSFLEKHGMLSTAQQVQQGEKDKAAKTAELKGAGILA